MVKVRTPRRFAKDKNFAQQNKNNEIVLITFCGCESTTFVGISLPGDYQTTIVVISGNQFHPDGDKEAQNREAINDPRMKTESDFFAVAWDQYWCNVWAIMTKWAMPIVKLNVYSEWNKTTDQQINNDLNRCLIMSYSAFSRVIFVKRFDDIDPFEKCFLSMILV